MNPEEIREAIDTAASRCPEWALREFLGDTQECGFCLREPAHYNPFSGIYVCAKCRQEMDKPQPEEEV